MKLRHLCLLLLAVVACAAAQSEDDIPVENDNQFPPDNISELERDVLNEPEDIVDDITTQPSDQPADDSTLSTIETVTPNTDITTETSITPVEDTQSMTQEDVVATENKIASNTTEANVDAVDELTVTEISTLEDPVNEDVTTETSTPLIEDVPSTELEVQEAIEVATSAEPVNGDVITETSTPLIEDVQSPELEVQEATEVATSADPVETVSTEPTLIQGEEVQTPTTEPDIATSEIDTKGEPIDADATDLSVAVDQDQGEPIDAANTGSSSLGGDVSFPTNADETNVGDSNDSAIGVAKFSVLLAGDVQLPTTQVDLKENSEVGSSTESVLDVTTEPSVPLAVDEQLPTDDSDVKETTDIVSPIEPLDVYTTETVNTELPRTDLEEKDKTEVDTSETNLDGSVIAKNYLQTTQTNEESLNDGATITQVSPIDPSEFSIRSNKARNDLEAISPLTLPEPPKEVVAPQEVDLPKDTKADTKVEDVSVGATTSVNKAGGIDKSVIAVIVAGMVVVVAGITIKKNWKSIKNKFSSSPRPANDRTNHTNGITPEEVPLQDKDNKNPSPV